MTNKEAIEQLRERLAITDYRQQIPEYYEAIELAVEALEKQIPKKPIYSDYDDNGFGDVIPYTAKCPVCGYEFDFGTWHENHHCICGQALDWEEIK